MRKFLQHFGHFISAFAASNIDDHFRIRPLRNAVLGNGFSRTKRAGDAGRTTFRQRFREAFEGDASRISLYKDVSNGILPAGIEYYLPLFFDATATLFDYLPEHATLLLHGSVLPPSR